MKSLALAFLVAFIVSGETYAHPGRTASDGCHYCRTNCESWGVPRNARHCHGGLKEEPNIKSMLEAKAGDHEKGTSGPVKVNHSHSPAEEHAHPHL